MTTTVNKVLFGLVVVSLVSTLYYVVVPRRYSLTATGSSSLTIPEIPSTTFSSYTDVPSNLSTYVMATSHIPDELLLHVHSELYSAVIEPKRLCSVKPEFIVMVITTPDSFDKRKVFRKTILSPVKTTGSIVYAFVVGLANNDTNAKLVQENATYGDIIQGSFIDSYDNLTIKSIFMVHWTATNCLDSKFVFKIDDDVFARIDCIKDYIASLGFPRRSVIGSIHHHVKPILNKASKWYVTDYHEEFFPDYAGGPAYLISTDILDSIFQCAMQTPFLRLEDVFVTGICVPEDTNHISASGFNYQRFDIGSFNPNSVLTVHGYSITEIIQLWNKAYIASAVNPNLI